MPADGHTWKTTSALNQDIWESFQATDLATVREDLDASHMRLGALIRSHDDEELFEKRRYAWTGSTALGSYLISATSSHYGWAIKLLKRFAREVRTKE